MFNRIAHSISFAIVLALAALAQAQSIAHRQAPSEKTSIIIGRQLVRFVASSETPEWRLEVANQQGEVVFDSGFVHSPTLAWPLLNQQGEAVASGLYSYILAFKEPASETPRLQRGHIILDRPSQTERIWVTSDGSSGIGASDSGVKLTVVGSSEALLGGAELPASNTPHVITEGRKQTPEGSETAAITTFASGKVKERALTNLAAADDLVVNGNMVFTPNFTRDITMQNTSGGLRFYGAPGLSTSPAAAAIQFWGNDSAFPGQLYLDAGATNAGALIFRTAFTGGTITERMRVTSGGNVGIGTTAPTARLEVRGDIRLGSLGQYRATSGEENLRIIRGVVDGAGNIIVGSGYQVTKNGTGLYTISFNTAFSGPPTIMAAAEQDTQVRTINTAGVTNSTANLRTYFGTGLTDVAFHFIAIGPR
jgi:hypothetical protein